MKINIVNKHKHVPQINDIYIGRGSVLGNIYTHLKLNKTKVLIQVKTREEAISKYKEWLYDILENKQNLIKYTNIVNELNRIKVWAERENGVNLVCFCSSENECHGGIIKKLIIDQNND